MSDLCTETSQFLSPQVQSCQQSAREWFPTWLLSTCHSTRNPGGVWLQGVSVFLLSPLLRRAAGRAGMQLTLCMCTACSALTPEPCPSTGGVTARVCVCVTNWAGRADPARAAVPAELGTQPAPLEMPPGTSFFYLGLSKVEDEPSKYLTCKILLMLSSEPSQEGES